MNRFLSNFYCLLAMAVGLLFVSSCGDDEFYGKITGVAMVVSSEADAPRLSQVHSGDQVKLTIGATIEQKCDLGIVHISGVSYAPQVLYYIDDQFVGKTREYSDYFSVPYVVQGLAIGQHTLSVEIPDMYHNITYDVLVRPSTFEVVE